MASFACSSEADIVGGAVVAACELIAQARERAVLVLNFMLLVRLRLIEANGWWQWHGREAEVNPARAISYDLQ
jgi:hypothetical protein